ncbi:MAG: hypothetical protein PHP31_08930 [Lentimicrobiaceae bacterium]|nr:hypothetical protein [Lentimicrobiaceae bacterium]
METFMWIMGILLAFATLIVSISAVIIAAGYLKIKKQYTNLLEKYNKLANVVNNHYSVLIKLKDKNNKINDTNKDVITFYNPSNDDVNILKVDDI